MPQINIAPTRTNLIRLKKDLRFAKEGYEILDRKREEAVTQSRDCAPSRSRLGCSTVAALHRQPGMGQRVRSYGKRISFPSTVTCWPFCSVRKSTGRPLAVTVAVSM